MCLVPRAGSWRGWWGGCQGHQTPIHAIGKLIGGKLVPLGNAAREKRARVLFRHLPSRNYHYGVIITTTSSTAKHARDTDTLNPARKAISLGYGWPRRPSDSTALLYTAV